jgi:hypothetical protein
VSGLGNKDLSFGPKKGEQKSEPPEDRKRHVKIHPRSFTEKLVSDHTQTLVEQVLGRQGAVRG